MSDIKAQFEKLQSSKLKLRNSTAAERARKLNALWEATKKRKEDLFVATNKERGTHDLDVAAELMMVKSEIDFVAKHVGSWMKPEKGAQFDGDHGQALRDSPPVQGCGTQHRCL